MFLWVRYRRAVQLRSHQTNIDHYENILKTVLSDLERQFVQRRVSEERLAIAMLQFMSPSAPSRGHAPLRALKSELVASGGRASSALPIVQRLFIGELAKSE